MAQSETELAQFLRGVHPAVRRMFETITDLPTFLATPGKLSLHDRLLIVDQALVMLDMNYVHLQWKRSMYAVDPIQRLKLLKFRLQQNRPGSQTTEVQFHDEMTDIFNSVRDLHTSYFLPEPYRSKVAFVPFLIEECYENHQRKYVVSKITQGFDHPTFRQGVEVSHWNGIPIARAIEINGERQAGGNPDARRARGLEALTMRPMVLSLPPDEEFVVVGYRSLNGELMELRHPWWVFTIDENKEISQIREMLFAGHVGIDFQSYAVQQLKKMLFAPEAFGAEQSESSAGAARIALGEPGQVISTSMPTIFRAQKTPDGRFGYIRIFSFAVQDGDAFLAEFLRLLSLLPQTGLIIDVRGNTGGLISAGERLLQLLTPSRIEPEHAEFINTQLNLEICRLNSPSTVIENLNLQPWIESISRSIETGAVYSQGFPLTPVESCNDIGQKYFGPVVLIMDALCYSTTDILIAGFQDHEIGKILGTSANTGAGGANVWPQDFIRDAMTNGQPRFGPFKQLPNGANMSVAARRTTRVGKRAGTPVEDLGTTPDCQHEMTRRDLLEGNIDLIDRASKILSDTTPYDFSVTVKRIANGNLRVTAVTQNISRVDVYLDGRPHRTFNVNGKSVQFVVSSLTRRKQSLEVCGFDGDRAVAVHRAMI